MGLYEALESYEGVEGHDAQLAYSRQLKADMPRDQT